MQRTNQWTYFVLGYDRIKIGAARDPHRRLKDLQVGSPVILTLLAVSSESEWSLHERFRSLRCHGEWFKRFPRKIERYLGKRWVECYGSQAPVDVSLCAEEWRVSESHIRSLLKGCTTAGEWQQILDARSNRPEGIRLFRR